MKDERIRLILLIYIRSQSFTGHDSDSFASFPRLEITKEARGFNFWTLGKLEKVYLQCFIKQICKIRKTGLNFEGVDVEQLI